ncbi:ABC-2 family transporter protein [Geobacillus sp. BCO2]|nr:ABC-2 family transporter protein [Geobacillus sp. BCO2]
MNDVIWLVKYTLKRTFRRKINFLLYFGTPLAAILLSLFAYEGSPAKDVRIGVVNEDHGRVADDAIRFLNNIDHLSVKSVKLSAVDDQITSQKVDGVLIFPQGFSESVQHGQPRLIQLVSLKGAEITMFIKSYLHEYIDHLATLGRLANGDRDLFWKMYERYQQAPFRLSVHSLSDKAKQKRGHVSNDRVFGHDYVDVSGKFDGNHHQRKRRAHLFSFIDDADSGENVCVIEYRGEFVDDGGTNHRNNRGHEEHLSY